MWKRFECVDFSMLLIQRGFRMALKKEEEKNAGQHTFYYADRTEERK